METPRQTTSLGRAGALVYGVLCYLLFLGTFVYLMGFVENVFVPRSVDVGPASPAAVAVAINLALMSLFAIQHTIMARAGFKRWWTSHIPAVAERSTFVLITNLCLIALFWGWRPIPSTLWAFEGTAALVFHGIAILGWVIALISTFLVDHFDLFGLRQTFCYGLGRPYHSPGFREILLYKVCRHPLMLGLLIAFWATPSMTAGHLLFAAGMTVYVLLGIRIEEASLVADIGDEYEDYQRRVRALLPIPRRV